MTFSPRLKTSNSGFFLDIAPLIDMVFLLLTFFMLTSRFLPLSLNLELPEAKSQTQIKSSKAVVVAIDREKNIFLNNQVVSLPNLAKQLKQLMQTREDSHVILQADRNTPFGFFVKIMAELRLGNASNLDIEVQHSAQ